MEETTGVAVRKRSAEQVVVDAAADFEDFVIASRRGEAGAICSV